MKYLFFKKKKEIDFLDTFTLSRFGIGPDLHFPEELLEKEIEIESFLIFMYAHNLANARLLTGN